MPQVLQWPLAPDARRAVLETCAASVLRGEVVVLPTESVYVAVASLAHPDAVARLLAGRPPDALKPAVAVRDVDEARQVVPSFGVVGQRLARRCWPGPVVFAAFEGVADEFANQLPEAVRPNILPGGTINVASPHHAAVGQLLDELTVPIALAELIGDDGRPSTTPEAVPAAIRNAAAVIVEDGPTYFGQPATVIEFRGDAWAVRRGGAITAQEVAHLAARLVLFVCTGNTCRSPLAAVLCKKLLADRLRCSVDELPHRGFLVVSAGLAAVRGEPAATTAVEVAQELGVDLSNHISRPATLDLLEQADIIVGMTKSHLNNLAAYPEVTADVRLLGGEAGDLPDPIGGDRATYEACAGAIWQHLQGLVTELVQESEIKGQTSDVSRQATGPLDV
jgi:protein-tyrosine phosphatase